MSTLRRPFLAAAALAALVAGASASDLEKVRDRMKVEAQRVEKEFADERLAAYKLVRNDAPKLVEATEKLQGLLAMIRNDTSLDAKRREVFIVTLKADLDRVKLIAADRRGFTARRDDAVVSKSIATESRRAGAARQVEMPRGVSEQARSIIESRGRALADARGDRTRAGDRYTRVMREVDNSAIPEPGNMT